MHEFFTASRRRRQSTRRHLHHGKRAAVVRALTAARLYLGKPVTAPTLNSAAEQCGSNAAYTKAMVTVIKAEDPALLAEVLGGHTSLLKAAAKARKRAALIDALRHAGSEDRAAAGRVLGAAAIFDTLVTPAL